MASIQATRLKKGMLIKVDQDLFRVLELQHVTPGNLRGFVRVKLRNIRSGTLSDQKLRSEDSLERATLDEREMQYLYKDGDAYCFMDTSSYEQTHISSEALGDSVSYLKPEMTIQVEFYGSEPVGIELPRRSISRCSRRCPGSRAPLRAIR
jgi:elongation factor P